MSICPQLCIYSLKGCCWRIITNEGNKHVYSQKHHLNLKSSQVLKHLSANHFCGILVSAIFCYIAREKETVKRKDKERTEEGINKIK